MSSEYFGGGRLVALRDNYARLAFLSSSHETPLITPEIQKTLTEVYSLGPFIETPENLRATINLTRPEVRKKIQKRVAQVYSLICKVGGPVEKGVKEWIDRTYVVSESEELSGGDLLGLEDQPISVTDDEDQLTSDAAIVGMGFVLDAQFLKKGKGFFVAANRLDPQKVHTFFNRSLVPEVDKNPTTNKMYHAPHMRSPFPDGQDGLNLLLPPLSWVVSDTLRQQEALIDGATGMFHILTDIEDELNG